MIIMKGGVYERRVRVVLSKRQGPVPRRRLFTSIGLCSSRWDGHSHGMGKDPVHG